MKPAYLVALLPAGFAAANPTVYLIRHGEKPDGDGTGLSAQGVQRAQCLRHVFGRESKYDIQYIITQDYKPNGKRKRPYDTVKPLADDLKLTINHSCDRDDATCVKNAVESYRGAGNILICWEHKMLSGIAEELGGDDVSDYPSNRFDEIWIDPYPYTKIQDIVSEDCPGLDKTPACAAPKSH